ncbi:MAG: hypothetical protein FWC42_07680 [Proteobacteria bacterium]|nr:hypothetical protein [Pseudomonadota bacterium]
MADLLEFSPADGAEIYWAGNYPHNKISSGVNRLLKRMGAVGKVSFDREIINRQVAAIGRSFGFNDGVHAELLEAGRQIKAMGFALIAVHERTPLNGSIFLHVCQAGRFQSHETSTGWVVDLSMEDAPSFMRGIYVRGLASWLIRRQVDSLSGFLNLSYDDVEKGLANRSLDGALFTKSLPETIGGGGPYPQGSWFRIEGVEENGGIRLLLGLLDGLPGRHPAQIKEAPFTAQPADIEYLTSFLAPAIALAETTENLQIVEMNIVGSPGIVPRGLILPTPQAKEFIEAISAIGNDGTK